MSLVPNPKIKNNVSSLLANIELIHKQDISAFRPAPVKMLQEDLMAIGKALILLDAKAKGFEVNLLSEILTELNRGSNNMPYEYVLSVTDRELAATASQASISGKDIVDMVRNLPTTKLIQEALNAAPDIAQAGKEAAQAFICLIDMIILHDGTLTNEELLLVQQIEKLFK